MSGLIECNGECKFSTFIDEFEVVKSHIEDSREHMKLLAENMHYLKKLDKLDSIETNLLSAATGRDHVPLVVVVKLIRVMGAITTGLMGTIIFLLVGNHFSWWNLHG